MLVIKQKIIRRHDLRANRGIGYLFGDNIARLGFGGQAGEMRGESNAIGIVTKFKPTVTPDAYFYDHQYDQIVPLIDADFDVAKRWGIIVVPADGLGSGMARMPAYAPRLLHYIEYKIAELG